MTPQPEKIRSMFSRVASRYDKANSVLSFGIHHLWRKKLVQIANVKQNTKVLDCASGTGDLAIAFANQGCIVTATDFCQEMLAFAPAKSKGLNIKFEVADVMNLPYQDNAFDIATISFGIRNVADPKVALKELARVVKPGGQVIVLEFGQPNLPGFTQVYNYYSEKILPSIGGMVTGDKEAYQYLNKSASHFPCREAFIHLMNQSADFTNAEYTSLTGGIAYIYQGIKK